MGKCAIRGSFRLSSCKTLQIFSLRMYLMLLNLVHKLKCETNLTLSSTVRHIYSSQRRCFGAPFWKLVLKF